MPDLDRPHTHRKTDSIARNRADDDAGSRKGCTVDRGRVEDGGRVVREEGLKKVDL